MKNKKIMYWWTVSCTLYALIPALVAKTFPGVHNPIQGLLTIPFLLAAPSFTLFYGVFSLVLEGDLLWWTANTLNIILWAFIGVGIGYLKTKDRK